MSVTHLNIFFLNFSTLRSNFWKKCQVVVFEIRGVIDQVVHREPEYEVKTGTGSSFGRHFGEKPIFWVFLGPISPLIWGYEADIWGRILRLGSKYSGKISGRSSRASYICQVSHVGILGVSAQYRGGLLRPG